MSVPPISAHSDLTSFISPSYPRPRYTHDCRFRNPYPRLPTTDDLITIPTLLSPPFHSKLPPRPPVAPYLEIIIQRILNSFPPSWLLEPKSGEMFRTKQDATRRMQAFAFYSGVALYPEYNRKGRADKMRFSCVHFHPKWEERRIVEIPGTQSLGRNRLIQRVVRSFSGGGLRSVGLGCRCNVNLVRRSVGNGEGKEKEVWVLDVRCDEHNHQPLSVPFWYPEHDVIHPGALAIRAEMQQHITNTHPAGIHRQNIRGQNT